MQYDRSAHCVHYHRYHIVRARRYRHRVLTGDPGPRMRTVRRQVRRGNGVSILHGALLGDHVHMSVSVPPKVAISGPVRRTEGRSFHRIRRGLPEIRRRYRGRRFRGRGHFPATTGAITDGPVLGILTVTSLTLSAPAGSYSPTDISVKHGRRQGYGWLSNLFDQVWPFTEFPASDIGGFLKLVVNANKFPFMD